MARGERPPIELAHKTAPVVRRSLTRRLANPRYAEAPPSRIELDRWAAELASTMGLSAEMVMAAWKPDLKRRRLLVGGRPLMEERHALVQKLLEEWKGRHGTGSDGRLAKGFWPAAATQVRAAEGRDVDPFDDGAWLRVWWHKHLKRCSLTANLTD